METPEEFVGSNDQIHMPVRGRRTKRQRLTSAGVGADVDVSSSSSSAGGGGGGGEGEDLASSSSQTVISGEVIDQQEISTEEEEDMANCLILLAQGDGRPSRILEGAGKMERISSKRFHEMAVATNQAKAGFYVYECKTCNRTFPSFQALGGHRASHKKPKPTTTAVEEKIKKLPPTTTLVEPEDKEAQLPKILPVQIPNKPPAAGNPQGNKAKIHECSICGLEFTSGQALGGHMRRHRAVSSAQVVAMNNTDHHRSNSAMETELKRRNILELDLNLPAPEEDLRDTKFQFTPTPQTIVFSAPTLVDCHY